MRPPLRLLLSGLNKPSDLSYSSYLFPSRHFTDFWSFSPSFYVFLVLWCPKVYTILEVRPYQHSREEYLDGYCRKEVGLRFLYFHSKITIFFFFFCLTHTSFLKCRLIKQNLCFTFLKNNQTKKPVLFLTSLFLLFLHVCLLGNTLAQMSSQSN